MTLPEFQNFVNIIGAEIIVVVTALMVAYFKLKNQLNDKIKEVKTHTTVSVQKLNGGLSHVINSFDRPAWIKVAYARSDGEVEFRMLDLNLAYCKEFGFNKVDYVGKTDLEAGWEKEMADQCRRHDLTVWASGETETFVEAVRGKPRAFRKLRVQSADGVLKGVMGYEVEMPAELQRH